jgi:hypothetical protein
VRPQHTIYPGSNWVQDGLSQDTCSFRCYTDFSPAPKICPSSYRYTILERFHHWLSSAFVQHLRADPNDPNAVPKIALHNEDTQAIAMARVLLPASANIDGPNDGTKQHRSWLRPKGTRLWCVIHWPLEQMSATEASYSAPRLE